MVFDFGGLEKPKVGARSTNPREIFRNRPSGKAKVKELWQGQAQALDEWFKDPKLDTLISMYTGAGKTLVGVLIAQSFLQQGYRNVVYVCPTIDLIRQTVKEANGIGIFPTTYHQREFSDENFAQSKSFCITTYQALFNTRNKFRGERTPGAIIFDDAHVGERLVRDAFTITVRKAKNAQFYDQLARVIRDCFQDIGQKYNFEQIVSDTSSGSVALCPPNGVLNRSDEIESIVTAFSDSDIGFTLPYDYLRGHIQYCSITISKFVIEITPPFLPALQVGALEDRSVPKVFLSATVQSKGDIIRAFGRSPRVIEPDVDAGLGERLMLFGSALNGFCDNVNGIASVSAQAKVLIAVPSEREADKWENVAEAPSTANDFTAKLDAFRSAESGSFLLMGRYDGIDLPDDDCRVMVVDGVPVGSAQLERYLFERIRLDQTFFPRVANRFTQLFGRINRGKNDYGIYFIYSKDAENWLRNVANQAFFPKILQEQIRLSEEFCDQLKGITPEIVQSIVNQIIKRDPQWLGYYQAQIGKNPIEEKRITDRAAYTKLDDELAKCEANFMLKLWQGEPAGAINELSGKIEEVRMANPRLAGWYALWLGVANGVRHEQEAMFDWFDEARNRLGGKLPLPRRTAADVGLLENTRTVVEEGLRAFCVGSIPELNRRMTKMIDLVQPAFSETDHRKAEEAVRVIGAALGFESSRPCTDVNDGPDNLWLDHHSKTAIPIELKTDKATTSWLNSEEVGQVFQHLQWTIDNFPDYQVPGILVYSESSMVTDSSNPSARMFFSNRVAMQKVYRDFLAVVQGMGNLSPLERYARASSMGEQQEWSAEGLFARLAVKPLKA
ncbi:DEAD/DEAH box helicase family protein [Mesorhizobium sp. PAMC28654]|uniref:DEAD/DEAH box helicase family protein n=1 Tax=Mesorhizobium sp. PAMC28654 TaxID=2880934 RepID=UPI001D0B69B2|nr:DEAD/DEAH box helicase family protein [Mesorhizobium sp. PAMC28654]UDL87267.1 DEAD/DEAH box helicase family protein [Mesorhizobium sp. PAMC28654]